jgi:hypothetical protein
MTKWLHVSMLWIQGDRELWLLSWRLLEICWSG